MSIVKIDIDKKKIDYKRFKFVFSYLNEWLGHFSIDVFETTKGYHIYVYTQRRLSDKDILIFQLLLGSDYKREVFNYQRIKNKSVNWNVLFSEKYEVVNDKVKLVSYEKRNDSIKYKIEQSISEGLI